TRSIPASTSSRPTPRPSATSTFSGLMAKGPEPRTLKIALDAVGGDHAPSQIVAGGVEAHRKLGVEIVFLGPQRQVDEALTAAGAGKWAQIEDAPEVIALDEHPAQAVRNKKASSIVRGVPMAAAGRA